MKTKTEMKQYIATLVASKIELTRERVAIKRKPFSERTSEEHWHMLSLWDHGRAAKETIRTALLAYAFVRGRRYWEVERYCPVDNAPDATRVALAADAPSADVEAWIAAPVDPDDAADYKLHLMEAEARARVEREARRKARAAA